MRETEKMSENNQAVSRRIAKAAAFADVSDETIRRAVASGNLRHARIGRKILILDADLKAWIEGRVQDRYAPGARV